MIRKCPYCNNELQQVAKKLICISNKCNFQCRLDEFEYISEPWGEKVCRQKELWNDEVISKFPYIIAVEYKRLYTLLEDDKLYGALFQIKDFFEVLLKFPILLIISRYCNNVKRDEKQSEIIKFLLENKLSLGNWKTVADKCLKIEDNSSIMRILNGIVNLYNSNNITNWRNDTIGHGALKFDESEEFRKDIEEKLLLIKKYLDEFSNEYINLDFGYKDKKKCYTLQGLNANLKNLNDKSNLYFYYNNQFVEINSLMVIHKKGIYFFDSYFKNNKKTKMLNYVDAKTFQKKMKYFEELFNNICKEVKFSTLNNSSLLSDNFYMSNEEELLNQIETQEQIIIPKYIYNWLNTNITDRSKGVFLLRMEEGMGKTVFSKLLDPHSKLLDSHKKRNLSIDGATIRTYYINNMYSYKINVFRNNLIDILRYDNKRRVYIKGDIPNFRAKDINEKKKEFVEILNKFKDVYKNKFGTDKLVLILDGLDEINVSEKETILDYIPTSEMLNQGIYLLLTARNSNNNMRDIYTEIDKVKSDSTLVIDRNNGNYISTIKTFLRDKCELSDDNEVNNILQISNNKFLYIKPIQYVLKYREFSELKKKNINFFEEFIQVIKELYTEKYSSKFINILLTICVARRNLTIEEISYMLSGEKPDFKFIACLSDASCLLTKERSYRGNTIGVLHSELRKYLLNKYSKTVQDMSKQWLNEVLESGKNYNNVEEGKLFLIFNSIDIAKNYNKEYTSKIIKKFTIDEIAKYISNNKKRYEFELLLNFCDDYIDIVEEEVQKKHSKKNLDKLIDVYMYKTNMILNYGINSDVAYVNDINRVFQLLELNNQKDINKIVKAYELRSNYYRKIGNIKKSMDDINEIAKIISNIEESNIDDYQISNLSKANIKLQKAINLKNLEKIDDALNLSFEALDLINDNFDIDAIANKSNILNNIGLCYRTKGNLGKAENYILHAIELCEKIKENKEIYNSNIYKKYANLGQILRIQGNLEQALEVYNKTINKINLEEKKGYIIGGDDKSLLYNARGNIYWDLGKKNVDNELYKRALKDYIVSEKIIESMAKDNQNMIFLSRLYSNIAKLYKYYLNDNDSAQKYINKFNDVRRELIKKQLDIRDINEDDLDRGNLLQEIQMSISKAEKAFYKNDFNSALKFYQQGLDILESSELKQDYNYIKTDLYYNKATCRKNMLQEKVELNFSLRKTGIRISDNYDKFKPNEIINDFLEADKCILDSKERKGNIYIQISYVYCEALMEYEKSKIYARKVIETGVKLDLAYLMLGNCYYEERNYEKAIEYYKKVSSKSSNYKTAQENIRVSKHMIFKSIK